MSFGGNPLRRAWRTFWVLTVVAILAAGSLSAALHAPNGAGTGLRVAGSGLLLVVATALAARILIVIERTRRRGEGNDIRPG